MTFTSIPTKKQLHANWSHEGTVLLQRLVIKKQHHTTTYHLEHSLKLVLTSFVCFGMKLWVLFPYFKVVHGLLHEVKLHEAKWNVTPLILRSSSTLSFLQHFIVPTLNLKTFLPSWHRREAIRALNSRSEQSVAAKKRKFMCGFVLLSNQG